MAKPISRELLQEAVDGVVIHGSQVAAAHALKIPRETLQARLRSARTQKITPAANLQTAKDREFQGLKDQVRDLGVKLKDYQREELTEARVRREIFGLADKTPDAPAWVIDPPVKHKATLHVPCLLWSDWHWGEVVKPDQVNGINEFDIKIARERLRTLVERTIDLCFSHMVAPNYPGIVVNLGGDMISGDIHEELAETNELESLPTLVDLVKHLVRALRTLADKFGRVFVPCVAGNHGRTTRRPRFKNRAFTNLDWLGFQMLEMALCEDKRIQFMIPSGTDAAYTVFGHRYLLTHGDNLGVKGGDGIIGALGPILRGEHKIRNSNSVLGEPYDTLLLGHWHQWIPMFPRLCVNGSLKGYDEFAKLALRAPPEEPQQGLWFTHPQRGVTAIWPVKMGRQRAAAPSEWVSWRQAA